MRYPIIIAALLVTSCGSVDSKDGDLTTNNVATNNVATNNVATNNVATNNVATNNASLELCGPDPGAPERQLGLSGIAIEGEAAGFVTGVEQGRLDLLIDDVEAQFFFEGGDLTEIFQVENRVNIVVVERRTDDGLVHVESIAGERGFGAELGWATVGAPGGEPEPVVMELPLAAATVSLGAAATSMTCLVEGLCAMQPRTKTSNAIAIEYRGQLSSVELGADLLDDEYSLRNLRAGSLSFTEVAADMCSLEGGTTSFFTVSSWGRVFL